MHGFRMEEPCVLVLDLVQTYAAATNMRHAVPLRRRCGQETMHGINRMDLWIYGRVTLRGM
jgi:hypothetical protein